MQPKSRLWTGDFGIILAISLLSYIGCQGLNNGTPIYVGTLGGTNAFAGMLILEFSLAAAVARIAIGRTIDRRTRRGFMIAGAVLLLIGTAGVLPFPFLESQVVFRAVQGVGFGAITTASSTATADVAPTSRLGEALGYYGLGQSLGFAVGPSLAIVLTSFAWHETLFAGIAIVSLSLIVLSFACGYEKHPERLDPTSAFAISRMRNAEGRAESVPSAGSPVSDESPHPRSLLGELFEKGALPGAIPMMVSCLGYAMIVSFVSKYGVQQGIGAPGLFFVCAAVTMTAVRLGGGRLIDRLKPLPLLAAPTACGVACFALLATTTAEPLFYSAGALFGLSMGLAYPLFNTVAVKCAPTERRGAASALYGLANDVGIGVGSVAWGAVIDSSGYTIAFWGGATMLVATFAVAAAVFPKR